MKTGVELISEERKRQIEKEGYSLEHDANHNVNEFTFAAMAYLACNFPNNAANEMWPWELEYWKPKDLRKNLIRAGALIAAALDRLGDENDT